MLRSSRLKICRGTELLDELATILPNLYSFNKDNDLEFASTIILLNRYWDNLKERTDNNSELRSEFIRILHKMAILYGEVNIPVACGARVIACDVESSYLNDEEAQLVHCITGIHIDRATSIFQAKSTGSLKFWRNLVPGFSPPYIAPMLSSGKIAATGQPIVLILMRAFDALASPRQGTLRGSVRRRRGCLVSAWSICGDKGVGLTPTASALPSQCCCGPE